MSYNPDNLMTDVVREGRIPGLDGLRAIAITVVLLGHGATTVPSAAVQKVMSFIGCGAMGVSLFFVISGYIITHLLVREQERDGTVSLRAFYRRRIFRILPPYYVFLAALAVASELGIFSVPAHELGFAAAFTTDYFLVSWWLGHSWSLSIEEQFYLLWPWAVAHSRGTARKVAIAVIVLGPLLRVGTYFFLPSMRTTITANFHTRCDSLMFGAALALFEGDPRLEKLVGRIPRWWPVPTLAVLLALRVIMDLPHSARFYFPLGYTLEAFCFAVVLAMVTRHPRSGLVRVLETRPFVFVGLLSYSLYLWQQPFLTDATREAAERNLTWTGRFPLNYLCAFAFAWASWRFVEGPFRKLGRARTPSPASARPLT